MPVLGFKYWEDTRTTATSFNLGGLRFRGLAHDQHGENYGGRHDAAERVESSTS